MRDLGSCGVDGCCGGASLGTIGRAVVGRASGLRSASGMSVGRLPRVVGLLLKWYAREARDLPWRRTRDPYRVLVSELMLQQTQVSRVIPRYEAWVARWPTAAALASAAREDVLAAWLGLGYNRRALALGEAARSVARDGWPEDLRDLPGV